MEQLYLVARHSGLQEREKASLAVLAAGKIYDVVIVI
jgi:hypothetical protein